MIGDKILSSEKNSPDLQPQHKQIVMEMFYWMLPKILNKIRHHLLPHPYEKLIISHSVIENT